MIIMGDFITWVEPYPSAIESNTNDHADLIIKATKSDCIGMMRRSILEQQGYCYYSDEELLHSFMAVHWAVECEKGY